MNFIASAKKKRDPWKVHTFAQKLHTFDFWKFSPKPYFNLFKPSRPKNCAKPRIVKGNFENNNVCWGFFINVIRVYQTSMFVNDPAEAATEGLLRNFAKFRGNHLRLSHAALLK